MLIENCHDISIVSSQRLKKTNESLVYAQQQDNARFESNLEMKSSRNEVIEIRDSENKNSAVT